MLIPESSVSEGKKEKIALLLWHGSSSSNKLNCYIQYLELLPTLKTQIIPTEITCLSYISLGLWCHLPTRGDL